MSDWNKGIITEFRSNHGKVDGYFAGRPILLINHTGARTGIARTNPLTYLKDGNRYLVFASKSGADTNPDWFYNLKAHPDVKIEVGDDTMEVHAEEITGAERDKLYARHSSIMPQFAEYAQKTKRIIPVIALTPRNKKLISEH